MSVLVCSQCKRRFSFTNTQEHPHFPFCSRTCRLIDLGEWLNESYTVAGAPLPDGGDEDWARFEEQMGD